MNIQWLYKKRFEFLLLSFLLLMFGNTLLPLPKGGIHIWITQNMLTGILVFYRQKQLGKILTGILVTHTILALIQNNIIWLQQHNLKPEIYLLYFILISYQVYKYIFKSDTISVEIISAVMCGSILLCFIATFLFSEVEAMHSNSFSNIGTGVEKLDNLNYFSVMTLLTVGFGDIVPLTFVAKRCVMVMVLASHFYTVFVTAIVIGKYLNDTKPSS